MLIAKIFLLGFVLGLITGAIFSPDRGSIITLNGGLRCDQIGPTTVCVPIRGGEGAR